MGGAEGGRVDGLLQVHAAVDMTQEEIENPLILLIAPRRTERHVGLAVLQRKCWR